MSKSSPPAFRTFGLVGFPLSHSFSKKYFDQKFRSENIANVSYGLFPMKDKRELQKFVESKNYSGLNVTIPYKQAVIPMLDECSEEAEAIGAVNVIHNKSGYLMGYNTDCLGFDRALEKDLGPVDAFQKALILGTGGSARSIAFALRRKGIKFSFVSRTRTGSDFSYETLSRDTLQAFKLIINCTPVGMWPDIHDSPQIPYDGLTDAHALFDLVYNPPQTTFLERGKIYGARTCNGMKMLVEQAEAAWEIWNS
ncbi:MAG: shikimate dehydrogenase [Bacteroidetes bacterium]|jgi:shikimate dehydrogenase|nr:shikimate dehydrogenase [Bacteroidota bacterium]